MTIATSHLRLAQHTTPLTASEALKADLVPSSLPSCAVSLEELASVWGYGNKSGIVVKILRKGLPWAKSASRDSIFALLTTLCRKRPKIVETMIFGNYTHACAIAPIAVRLKLTTTAELISFVEHFPAQTCLALITEFLVASTIHYSALHALVKDVHWWRSFRDNAIMISDGCLRPRFLCNNFTFTTNYPGIVRAKQPSFEYDAVWPLLLKAFEINTRLKPATIKAAGSRFELAQKLGSATVLGAGLIEADLVALQVPVDTVKKIIASGTAPPNRAMKHMRSEIKALTTEQHALLKTYIHARHAIAFESVSMVRQPQSLTALAPMFTYCRHCQTCRSKFVTLKGVSKRLHGLEVDFKQDMACCSTCQTKRVQVMVLKNFIFTTKYVNRAIYSLVFCSSCATLSADVTIIGEHLLCKHCVKQHQKRQVSGPCQFCAYPATQQFVGLNRSRLTWINVCDSHKGVVSSSWGVSVEALAVINQAKLDREPKRHHGSRKRACDTVLRLPRHRSDAIEY